MEDLPREDYANIRSFIKTINQKKRGRHATVVCFIDPKALKDIMRRTRLGISLKFDIMSNGCTLITACSLEDPDRPIAYDFLTYTHDPLPIGPYERCLSPEEILHAMTTRTKHSHGSIWEEHFQDARVLEVWYCDGAYREEEDCDAEEEEEEEDEDEDEEEDEDELEDVDEDEDEDEDEEERFWPQQRQQSREEEGG